MIEVVVAGLGRPPGTTGVLLLLKEREGPRMLPVGIGAYEAEAIALHFQGFSVPRPLTHDLLAQVMVSLQGELQRVELSALEQGTFYARLMVDQAGHQLAIDSRPSDAVALAVRVAVPIFVAETVLDQAGVLAEQPEETEEGAAEIDVSKLSVFKEFIDTLDENDEEHPGGPESSS
jgi:bifunctional DNase/RNase